MIDAELPEGFDAAYVNEGVQQSIRELHEHPDDARLKALLDALPQGFLVVDVTTPGKKKGTRVRTLRATTGGLVLPVFTSLEELRLAVPAKERDRVRGAFMPARDALALVHSDRFVAVQVDVGSSALVIKRSYIEQVLAQ